MRQATLPVALTALALAGCSGPAPAPSLPSATAVVANAFVVAVVDGDTLDVDVDGRRERVRLIGIDTPETKAPDRPVECYGPEATALTEQLVPSGTPVRLARDVEPRDTYGRLLVYVARASDGTDVAQALVEAGAAVPLVIEPNTARRREIADAAEAARRAGRGLWGACRR
jgi:micrococcal nuclease